MEALDPAIAIFPPQSPDDPVLHSLSPEGIHRLTFQRTDAINGTMYIDKVIYLYRHYPQDRIMLLISDAGRTKLPNLSKTFRYAARSFEGLTLPPIRSAFILPNQTLIHVIRGFLDLLRFSETRRRYFYPEDDEQVMIQWLLSERADWEQTMQGRS
jgi:hypothetical protein